jgi:hypothetical protein
MKETTLKHFVERPRLVFDEGSYCGALLATAKGIAVHDDDGECGRSGEWPDESPLCRPLRYHPRHVRLDFVIMRNERYSPFLI